MQIRVIVFPASAVGAEMPTDLPLRDIHLPAEVGVWPLAPGWWLFFSLLVVAFFLGWRYWQGRRLRRLVLARLEQLTELPDAELATALSRLLRQAVICHFPQDYAGLIGQEWLDFLDRPFNDHPFTQGVGRSLLDAPYRHDAQIDRQALVALCRRWLKQLPPQPVWQRRG